VWSEASLGKSLRPYLKNKVKAKGLVVWFKWERTVLPTSGPEFNPNNATKTHTKKDNQYLNLYRTNHTGIKQVTIQYV
jgi:hypothetical protein